MSNTSTEWKHIIAKSFSKASKNYETVAQVQKQAAFILGEQIFHCVEQPKNILEFGAGTGFLTKQLLQVFNKAKVVAIDFSISMLNELKKNLFPKEKKRISLRIEDMDQFDDQKKYSLICSSFALQWSQNPLFLLSNSYRFLKPQGFIAHIFPILGSLSSMSLEGYLQPIPQLSLSVNDVLGAVEPFKILKMETFEIYQKFSSPLDALKHIKAFGGSKGSTLQKNLYKIAKMKKPIVCEWILLCLIAQKKH